MLTLNNKSNKYFVVKNEFSNFCLEDEQSTGSFHDYGYSFETSIFPETSSKFKVYSVGKGNIGSDLAEKLGLVSEMQIACDIQGDKYDKTVVWDLFGTNNLYINGHVLSSIGSANDVIPCVYFTNVMSKGNLSNHSTPVGEKVLVDIPGGDSIIFVRYAGYWYETFEGPDHDSPSDPIVGYIDGWATYYEHCFNVYEKTATEEPANLLGNFINKDIIGSDIKKNIKPNVQFANSSFDAFMDKQSIFSSFNESFSDFLNSNSAASKAIGKSFVDYIKASNIKEDKDIMSDSCSLCSHYTVSSEYSTVTADSYSFANIPKNVAICSHPERANTERVTYCSYSPQSECSVYVSSERVLKYYSTQGSDSVSFKAVKTINSSGSLEVLIYNVENNQVSYALLPPSGISDADMISELDEIVQEILGHWSDEVTQTLEVSLPVVDSGDQGVVKKTFLLSLV